MKKKVLVIDDEPEVRRLIRRVLQKMEHEVIEAEDGTGVTQLIRHECPDLVLLDIHMPRLDGIAAMDEIRDIDPALPIVMVTGDLDRVKLIALYTSFRVCFAKNAKNLLSAEQGFPLEPCLIVRHPMTASCRRYLRDNSSLVVHLPAPAGRMLCGYLPTKTQTAIGRWMK